METGNPEAFYKMATNFDPEDLKSLPPHKKILLATQLTGMIYAITPPPPLPPPVPPPFPPPLPSSCEHSGNTSERAPSESTPRLGESAASPACSAMSRTGSPATTPSQSQCWIQPKWTSRAQEVSLPEAQLFIVYGFTENDMIPLSQKPKKPSLRLPCAVSCRRVRDKHFTALVFNSRMQYEQFTRNERISGEEVWGTFMSIDMLSLVRCREKNIDGNPEVCALMRDLDALVMRCKAHVSSPDDAITTFRTDNGYYYMFQRKPRDLQPRVSMSTITQLFADAVPDRDREPADAHTFLRRTHRYLDAVSSGTEGELLRTWRDERAANAGSKRPRTF